MTSQQPFSIYIHVPFCRQACSYCDFYFVTQQQLIPAYVEALVAQLNTELPAFMAALPGARLQSVYFGGGTPSRLPSTDIARILSAIDDVAGLSHATEITLEANPDDVNPAFLAAVRACGVHRLSMGIQSFEPELLAFMHRAHSSQDALRCLGDLEKAGFDRFSVDLIYGNPGQSEAMLNRDLKTLLQFAPPHVSAYALTIEPETRLGKARALGRLHDPDDALVARQMDIVAQTLSASGIHRYEVSNFARLGHEAIHNSAYWEHIPYLGLGPGAHSLLTQQHHEKPFSGGIRWDNPPDLRHFITHWTNPEHPKQSDSPSTLPPTNAEHLTPTQLAEERLLMALRTRKGITPHELTRLYRYTLNTAQIRRIETLRNHGFILSDDPLRLTPDGLRTADAIILDLVALN